MRFNIHALDAAQQVVAVTLDAASEAEARETAGSRGLAVFSLEQDGRRRWQPRLARKSAFRSALFSIELRSLLEAGLNLVEALQTLAEKEPAGERAEVLSGMLAAINRGEPFSRAGARRRRRGSPGGSRSRGRWRRFRSTSRRSTSRRSRRASAPAT